MTHEEQDSYRQHLLEKAAQLRNDETGVVGDALRQAGGEASGNLSNVPMHLADFGTDAFEQEMSASLLANARQLRAEIAAALDRMDQGTFGQCQECSRDIGKGRLQAVPYTRYCVDCAQIAENDGEAGFLPTLL
jgi:DnaK suppressor protein